MDRERIEDLIFRHFDGDLSQGEMSELNLAIENDPEAARLLKATADQQILLSENLGRKSFVFYPPRPVKLFPRMLAVAALLIAAISVCMIWPNALPSLHYRGDSLFVFNENTDLKAAQSIEPGQRYLARSGELRLGATSMTIKAPTVFQVPKDAPDENGRWEAALFAGHVSMKTRSKGDSILIRTKHGTLQNRGTHFEVKLNDWTEEKGMLRKIKAGVLRTFVVATVFSGLVAWIPQEGEEIVVTPEMGRVNLAYEPYSAKVEDQEGLAFIKPVLGNRWTLAKIGIPIDKGDWIKTSPRGANAVTVRMKKGPAMIIGPSGLVEIVENDLVRIYQGEVEISGDKENIVKVKGPDEALRQVADIKIFRAGAGKMEMLANAPRWLTGYKGKSSKEAMGELLANVDGRNTPLTIGYHKVTVDIRDQIARTMIEESFVNHTKNVLEGVFYFPLPQDASISGFAMWIGGEMVAADIVEKERAREIFETILREKRDPGLLEWTGGNIFKARIYPIPAHGEKRIRITYTQVLPKEGNSYRYNYSLKSELLKQNPLRELELDVRISSNEQLASIVCPSHMARIQKTSHAAQVEFSAQEYRPDQDFEVIVQTEHSKEEITVIPHMRDDEGYFMVLLQDSKESDSRQLISDSEPVDLIIMADTSGSMTDSQLEIQRQFIAGLLESLSDKDSFNLLGFDVNARWAFPTKVPVTEKKLDEALAFLHKRGALGWTDLDLAFKEAAASVDHNTNVIYIGDGIPTTGDADPIACAARLKRVYPGKGSFHAVAIGATFEQSVIKAIASMGSGSMRTVKSAGDAAGASEALLREITSPGMKDIEFNFTGVRIASVYPETVPNLASGRQQIILGRYLPEGERVKASLKVTGTIDNKKVTREVAISFAKADKGNSFIPRFWARMHLDYLLEQGANAEIKNRIISLSENYQIMTPYTSFLVLESDADRERFNVKKRLYMRGGEEFFAKGRDDANYAIARKQMLAAMSWRKNIVRGILKTYSGFGRRYMASKITSSDGLYRGPGDVAPRGASAIPTSSTSWGAPGGWMPTTAGKKGGYSAGLPKPVRSLESFFYDSEPSSGDRLGLKFYDGNESIDRYFDDGPNNDVYDEELPEGEAEYELEEIETLEEIIDYDDDFDMTDAPFDSTSEYFGRFRSRNIIGSSIELDAKLSELSSLGYGGGSIIGNQGGGYYSRPDSKRIYGQSRGSYLGSVFPYIENPKKEFNCAWSKDVRQLIEMLNRKKSLVKTQGGISIDSQTDFFNNRGIITPGYRGRYILSSESWSSVSKAYPGDIPVLRWVDKGLRGVCDTVRLLGLQRKAEKGDVFSLPSPVNLYFDDLEEIYKNYIPSIVKDGDSTVLKLTHKKQSSSEIHIAIDTKRCLIVSIAGMLKGETEWKTLFSEFEEVSGSYYPKKIEQMNSKGKINTATTISYKALEPEELKKAMEEELVVIDKAVLLKTPLPELIKAKKRHHDDKAGLEDLWLLINHFTYTEQWDKVNGYFTKLEKLAQNKPGLDWIRIELFSVQGKIEDMRKQIFEIAGRLNTEDSNGKMGVAISLYYMSLSRLQAVEVLKLLDILSPVMQAQDKRLLPMKKWNIWKRGCLDNLSRLNEAFEISEELAFSHTYDLTLLRDYAHRLSRRGETAAAIDYLDKHALKIEKDAPYEAFNLRRTTADYIYNQRRLVEFLDYSNKWLIVDKDNLTSQIFNMRLSALIMLDRTFEADSRIARWLAYGFNKKLNKEEKAKLMAAVKHALSKGNDLYCDKVAKKWRPTLSVLASTFALDKDRADMVGAIINCSSFMRTDEGAALRKELYKILSEEIKTAPINAINNLVNWTRYYYPTKDELPSNDMHEALFDRLEKETEQTNRSILENLVISFNDIELTIRLRRYQLDRADGAQAKKSFTVILFNLLLSQPYSKDIEDELFTLAKSLGFDKEKNIHAIDAVQAITKYITVMRAKDLAAKIPNRNSMSRRALRPLEIEASKKAKAEAIKKLKAFEKSGIATELIPFVEIEIITLEMNFKKDPIDLMEKLVTSYRAVPEPTLLTAYAIHQKVLSERRLTILAYLATRPKTDESIIQALMALLDEGIEKKTDKIDPKLHKYRILAALDRAEELKVELKKWVEEAGAIEGNRWKIPYGYILAEQGELDEAVKVFLSVKKEDELGPAEHRSLADWLLALDRKSERREAKIKAFMTKGAWSLHYNLEDYFSRNRDKGLALEEDVFLRFSAMMRKSGNPGRHLNLLTNYYKNTKDFRLLEILPEAVIGQSAAKIYDFLKNIKQVTNLIQDEATVDRIENYLAIKRETALSAVDRRALFMIEFLVRSRAADQAIGQMSHIEAAMNAMKKAFKGEWADGEMLLMAKFLAGIGSLVSPLDKEILSQLQRLHDMTAPKSQARFDIGLQRSSTLYAYDLRVEAIRILSGAIEDHRDNESGLLQKDGRVSLKTLGNYLQSIQEYKAAERMWRGEIAREYSSQNRRTMQLSLYYLYGGAIEAHASTDLGEDFELYSNARDEIIKALKVRTSESHAQQLVESLSSLFSNAHYASLKNVKEDAHLFGYQILPRIISMYNFRNSRNIVSSVANLFHKILGGKEALQLVVTRAEAEPDWLTRMERGCWKCIAYRISKWRKEVGDLGDLEPRFLALVLKDLRRSLEARNINYYCMFYKGYNYYWNAKTEEFYKAADQYLNEHWDSERGVKFVANYFFQGLGKKEEAIDALQRFYQTGKLGEDGRFRLVNYLQKTNRFKESIPYLEGEDGLKAMHPGSLKYWTALMKAYFKTGRIDQLIALSEEALIFFRKENRWSESIAKDLAEICLETELHENAASLYEESITLRKQNVRSAYRGDGTISYYYANMARAYSGLGNTQKAVDAVAGAIVSWGNNIGNRKNAEAALRRILKDAKDLDEFVQAFEKECAKTRLENPVLRKALGLVYMDKKNYEKAVLQFEAYVESGPVDQDVINSLIKAYDNMGNKEKATQRLLFLAREKRHEFDLYRKLGDRLKNSELTDLAQRAYSTLAEMSAHESEGRAIFANILEGQRRFSDGAVQWRQVMRIRAKEPLGYLGLARCLIGDEKYSEAQTLLEDIIARSWPSRFSKTREQARDLLRKCQ